MEAKMLKMEALMIENGGENGVNDGEMVVKMEAKMEMMVK
jgi:hypothetical protein